MEPYTATATRQSQRNMELEAAMHRLLHDLRPFMGVYLTNGADTMPDHDLVWVDKIDGGPGKVILDAIKSEPALWFDTLSPEVCVLQKDAVMKMTGITSVQLKYLVSYGEAAVRCAAYNRRLAEMDR